MGGRTAPLHPRRFASSTWMLIFHASPTKMYIPQPHGKFNMAGANQPIDIDDREIRDGLKALQDKLGNLTPFYQDIGEALLNSTRRRFETQTAPDGSPWAPLSPGYEKRKKKNKDKILTLEGLLRGLLNYDASADALLVGTRWGTARPINSAGQHPGPAVSGAVDRRYRDDSGRAGRLVAAGMTGSAGFLGLLFFLGLSGSPGASCALRPI